MRTVKPGVFLLLSICIMCVSFPGAPGIIPASPYAGAGFPPTFAIPQAAGTVLRKLEFYIGSLVVAEAS